MINHRIGRTRFLLYYSVYVVFQIVLSIHKNNLLQRVTNSDIHYRVPQIQYNIVSSDII